MVWLLSYCLESLGEDLSLSYFVVGHEKEFSRRREVDGEREGLWGRHHSLSAGLRRLLRLSVGEHKRTLQHYTLGAGVRNPPRATGWEGNLLDLRKRRIPFLKKLVEDSRGLHDLRGPGKTVSVHFVCDIGRGVRTTVGIPLPDRHGQGDTILKRAYWAV